MNSFVLTLLLTFGVAVQDDEVAIRSVINGRAAAWEKQDVEHLVAPFAKDADYIDSSGTMTTGRDEIEAVYTKILASGQYKDSTSKQEVKKVRFVRPDVAVVDATWSLTGLKSGDGKPLPDRAGTSVLVLTKNGEKWEIVTLRVAVSAAKP